MNHIEWQIMERKSKLRAPLDLFAALRGYQIRYTLDYRFTHRIGGMRKDARKVEIN